MSSRNEQRMKIGFLGGSFDPIHFGHLIAAQDALEQHKLDRVILVPAAQAPLKPNDAQCPAADRLAMARAAVEGDSRFEVSDFETRAGGVSYTIDSARFFKKQFPRDTLFWIVGADQLPQLHKWKDIAELVKLVEFVFLERPGYRAELRAEIPGLRLHRCAGRLVEISSTELRARAREGRALDYLMPHKAVVLILKKGLYR